MSKIITDKDTDYTIFGTSLPMFKYSDKRFPMTVQMIAAPADPMPISVANYMSCIEGDLILPQDIVQQMTREEISKQFEWILKGGHTPSLECIHLTFGIKGASVVLLKQISRHRIGNSLENPQSFPYFSTVYFIDAGCLERGTKQDHAST